MKRLLRRFFNSRWSTPLWKLAFSCVGRTSKVDVRNHQQMAILRSKGMRVIYVCRHGNILPTLGYMAYRLYPKGSDLHPLSRPAILTNGGPEGRIIQMIMGGRGHPIIRTHDHNTALIELAEVMGKGYDAAMTIDQKKKDDKGRSVSRDQHGCALLARRTGAVIVPVAAGCRLRNVRLEIPWPGFFRVLRFGHPIEPPIGIDAGRALVQKTREIGRALDQLKERVDVECALDRRKLTRSMKLGMHGILFVLGLFVAALNITSYVTLLGLILAIYEAKILASYTSGFSTKIMTGTESTVGEARTALTDLFSKVSDETTRDGERTVKVVCGSLEPLVYGDNAVLTALESAVKVSAIPQFILTSCPKKLPERLEILVKAQRALIFVHKGRMITPHFAVVNEKHVRLEWTHEAGHYEVAPDTPRQAETHFYTASLGATYDRIFDSIRDHKDTQRCLKFREEM